MHQMMLDPSKFAHTICRNDYKWTFSLIESLRVLHRLGKIESCKTKGILGVGCKKIVGFLIVAFRMYNKYTCSIESHGRIHPYRNIGYPTLIMQKMKAKDQLLRALHCKGWNYNLAPLLSGPIYNIFEV